MSQLSITQRVVEPDGRLTKPWLYVFQALQSFIGSLAPSRMSAVVNVPVSGLLPMTYTAPYNGSLIILAAAALTVQYTRDGVNFFQITSTLTNVQVRVAAGDQVVINCSVNPSINFFSD